MKTFISLAALFVLASAPAIASDGQVPQEALAKMGLGQMQLLTDAQGAQVRGQSFAVTFSRSRAGGTTQTRFRIGVHHASSHTSASSGGSIAFGGASASAF